MKLNVVRYSDNVSDMLSKSLDWTVKMIFNSGALLTSDAEALFIGAETTSPGPFHIALDSGSIARFLRDIQLEKVFRLNVKHTLLSECLLNFEKAQSYNCEVSEECNGNELSICALKKFLEQPDNRNGWNIPFKKLINEGIGESYSCNFVAENPSKINSFLKYCIGRGSGLTPTGDDFLIGFLSVFTNWAYLYEVMADLLKQKDLTTDVSCYYFSYALKKRFDYNILGLLNSIRTGDGQEQSKYMKLVSEYGHTSGIDTLTGIYFAFCCKKVLYGGTNKWQK